MCNGTDNLMADSDHEEADTRIVLHVIVLARRGNQNSYSHSGY